MTDEVLAAKRKLRDAKAELRSVKYHQELRAMKQREKDVYTSGTWRRDKALTWLIGNVSGLVVYVTLATIFDFEGDMIAGGTLTGFTLYNVGWLFFAVGVSSGRKYERHNSADKD